MKQGIFYKIVIVALLLLNTAVIGYLWLRPPAHDHHDGPRGPREVDALIIERLHLDAQQQELFDGLKHEHHGQMLEIQHESGELHNQLFALLQAEPVDTAARDAILTQLEANDRQKELVTFDHFKKLRGILHPEQKPDFDAFVDELGRRLMHQGPPEGRP